MKSTPLWLSSITLAAAGGWLAATMFAAPATSKAPRFPQLTMDQLSEAQKPLGEQVMKVSSVGIGGPYNPMLRSPVLGQRLFDLFYYLRWKTSVPTRLNEFAILIIGRQWRSQVEWFAHAPLAAKAGLSPDIIAELKANKRPSNMAEDEAWSTTSSPSSRPRTRSPTRPMRGRRRSSTTSRSSTSPRSPAIT